MSATKRWWRVGTKENNESGRDVMIGVYYGYLDEIALHLADKAQGFYQDVGTLTFKPTVPPPKRYPKTRSKVNIQVYTNNGALVEGQALKDLVRRNKADLLDSKYYDCTLLVHPTHGF